MSAGDVLFVGWTGGDPQYKELLPQIRYEPVNEPESFRIDNQETNFPGNYTRKIVMRRVICFSKDIESVVSSLVNFSGSLKSVYLDTDGSVKELDLGPGWSLLNYDSSEYAVGFSSVQVTYEKTIERAADSGLPEGMSIVCSNGVCSIKYNDTTLEEIDSGLGECSTGFNIKYQKLPRPSDPFEAQEATLIRASIVCNGVVADSVDIQGKDIPETEFLEQTSSDVFLDFGGFDSVTFSVSVYGTAQEAYNQALIYNINKTREILQFTPSQQIAVQNAQQLFVDNEFVRYSDFLPQTKIRFSRVDDPGGDTEKRSVISWQRRMQYKITTIYPSLSYTPSATWEKSGNVIKLKVLDKVWREYDVTGL